MPSILFISNNNLTDSGLSGGDRILIEFIKGWNDKINIGFLAAKEGISVLKKYYSLEKIDIYCSAKLKKTKRLFTNSNYFFHTLNRTFYSILSIFKYHSKLKEYDYIYSASDFYPDTIPAFLLKLLYPQKKWIAGFYLFAPSPFSKNNPYRSSFFRFLTGIFYWLTQKLSYFLVYFFADIVFVTSKPDVQRFISHKRKLNQVIIIQGGVDTDESHKFLLKNPTSFKNKKYLCVFIGRLHPQKGVLELIDIWRYLCQTIPDAKLAIIGNGQLLNEMKQKTNEFNLKKNINFFGFLDGQKKYSVFKNSMIVVHPATYDSGGMAAAEAMAWGLPGVSFDLESLKTYYPQGMIKTKCNDFKQFAQNIIKLSSNSKIYLKYSHEAVKLIESKWSWNKKCQEIFQQVFPLKTYE